MRSSRAPTLRPASSRPSPLMLACSTANLVPSRNLTRAVEPTGPRPPRLRAGGSWVEDQSFRKAGGKARLPCSLARPPHRPQLGSQQHPGGRRT